MILMSCRRIDNRFALNCLLHAASEAGNDHDDADGDVGGVRAAWNDDTGIMFLASHAGSSRCVARVISDQWHR